MAIADKNTVTRSGFYMMILASTLVITSCAAPPAKSPDESATIAANKAPEVVAEAEIVDDYEGDGMEIPLDGTSLETFEASLAQVRRHTDEDSYQSLQKAINYLLVYDLGAKRSREKLAARLDGLNGYEVMAKVGWRKPLPGTSNAVKGAVDPSIIDT